jgi:hypothetical protein
MKKINWDILSNADIQLKQLVLKENYENVKNKILLLMDEMDEMDREYIKSKNILNKRLGKK